MTALREIIGRVKVGSVLRAADGRRFVVKRIRKANPLGRDDGKEPSMMYNTDDDEITKLEAQVDDLESLLKSAIGKQADEAVADDGDADDAEEIAKLKAQVDDIGKTLQDAITRQVSGGFEQVCVDIQKRDGCSRVIALQKARLEAPDQFRQYQMAGVEIAKAGQVSHDRISGPPSNFDSLVNQIMATERKPRHIAMQLARKRDPEAFAKYQSA
jgi:hypothetical protein